MSVVENPVKLISGEVNNDTIQSITSGVNTPIIFNSEDFEIGDISLHSTTTNPTRFTNNSGVQKLFRFSASIVFDANPVGERDLFFSINGEVGPSDIRLGQHNFRPMSQGVDIINICTLIRLKHKDFTECVAFQNGAGPLNIGSVVISLNNRCEYNEIET